ncbi:HAMP domain-containing sensor histidine kinase [Mangrovimonas sp. TPBH4]|uniref:sensor histidine kinase n=1 Tax=Mangrovimonas sp. TPBH4 TaxID=1645914 RepID=UPI0006B56608|nr:HAMP domain-containing sensor histidine kinase [Mangrovimonas sp. TPBH4]
MNLNFKNRIALHYMVATALIMIVIFSAIFFVVKGAVLGNLDSDLSYEAEKHAGEIKTIGDSIHFINKAEWEEREHRELQVNPVFIQLINKEGGLMDKSPNLKGAQLPFKDIEFGGHFNTKLNDRKIRQVQIPVEKNGKIQGYILAAMSSEAAYSVIQQLRNILLISFLIVLIGLYYTSRFLAGRSIIPIQEITKTITHISKDNLKERVTPPQNQDEIYMLATGFNALLERIEKALEREKQFTSDASHELRTPLAALRGTLEVLIRKPRTQEEYEEKIKFGLKEIEKITSTLEQLLHIAHSETSSTIQANAKVSLAPLINESILKYKTDITAKNISINLERDFNEELPVPQYYSKIIIDNILSNAIKYSHNNSTVQIKAHSNGKRVACIISDCGVGIKKEDLNKAFESFFRSKTLNHEQVAGNGLGLSIAKKCADAIQADLTIESELGQGTKVTILF